MQRFEPSKGKETRLIAAGLTTAAVFVSDLMTPLGIAVWIFYLLPLAIALFDWRPRAPLLSAALSTALVIVGYFASPAGPRGLPRIAELNRTFAVVTFWVVALVVRRFIQSKLVLREQEWLRRGQHELGVRVQGEQSVELLADNILRFLCGYLDAPVGLFYVTEAMDTLRRRASYGASPQVAVPEQLSAGDTLVGQAFKERRLLRVDHVPPAALSVSTALVRTEAAHLLVAPAVVDGEVTAVIELGFLRPIGQPDLDFLESSTERIAIAIRSAQHRARQAELLLQTQRQAEELQVQQEELRAINEELEEQSHALSESQTRLEEQQAELEHSNAQLEEQKQKLEQQRDELARAQLEQLEKADALARANRYKSEFLANMSHELRTPLNSALILAKLLADNTDGNLTAEQVKYASTIHSSGSDLLALISDILDLSRIEAGHVDIRPEETALATVLGGLKKMFEPVAQQRGLVLGVEQAGTLPAAIKTDPLRLQQILRNLLANAIKFTEAGEVILRVEPAPAGRIAFAVHDTGLGIPADQHELIFEAFCQADGSTGRKYGGSGLGLTISRELARRLGGSLSVASEVGRGSTFTLVLPVDIDTAADTAAPVRPFAPSPSRPRPLPASAEPEARATVSPPRVEDDRAGAVAGERSILVVEDDARFATILRGLVREQHFRCLVANAAEEGLALAERFSPSAILLDVNLPDQSGLALLERLKASATTRHIPVHVMSVDDYTQQALEMGAVGYVLKPAQREQIVAAIARIEQRLAQPARRILIAENPGSQRDSVRGLLQHDGVEIVTVGRGEDALAQLQAQTYDCMVLDLALPDMTGYDLLEKMAVGEAYAFPPVVVYTGRPLDRSEEQRLRRYASSVVIKGARSPERLLDEVTLFLHQLEASLPPEQQRLLRLARQRERGFEGRTILVVEDDARNIFALSSVLEPRGAKLQIARNGREALDVLERDSERTVDLVLMDVMMPVMDGLAATREIRRRAGWDKLPIIGLTAKAMADDRRACLEAGMSDYIPKPLDVDKLVSLVKVWLPK